MPRQVDMPAVTAVYQVRLRTLFVLTALVAVVCGFLVNRVWLASQVQDVQTSQTLLESNADEIDDGARSLPIIQLRPRQVTTSRTNPGLIELIRWSFAMLLVCTAGWIWWRARTRDPASESGGAGRD